MLVGQWHPQTYYLASGLESYTKQFQMSPCNKAKTSHTDRWVRTDAHMMAELDKNTKI